MTRPLGLTLAASVVALAFWFGGAAGLGYLMLYVLVLASGLPIGWRLFGRAHPAGWVAGALFGYTFTMLAFWIVMVAGMSSRVGFAIVWILLALLIWTATGRARPPAIVLPSWSARDTAALLLVLHLVPALLALPFGRAGERDSTGTRYYRAYFTADFVWHVALTQEIARFDRLPVNPYLAPEPVHYYWGYFLVPAVLAGPEEMPLVTTEAALKINATGTALLLFSMIFLCAWSACGRSGPAAAASVLALAAPSLEGAYELVRLIRAGAPVLDALRDTNIDAVTAWPPFNGLRIDGLARSMWWTPQHSTSMALGLIGLLAATRMMAGTAASTSRFAAAGLTGLALGSSVAMNPFLGAAFTAIYGLTALIDIVGNPGRVRSLATQSLAAIPVLAALGWGAINRMSEGAGGALSFGWLYLARHAPVATFVLSFGGLILLVLLGLLRWRGVAFRPALPAAVALVIGVGLMYFVSLVDRAWVGFRAGNILLTTMPMLAARGLTGLGGTGRIGTAAALCIALVAAGAPTTLIDAYNAQDIGNRGMGPGFLWTIPITPAQQAGFAWIRASTATRAIVQADPIVRGRQNWSVIPSFAGRRMAAGLPISLLDSTDYHERSDRVHQLFTAMSPEQAHAAAHELGIEYLWLDQDDGPSHGEIVSRLAARPELFSVVFRRGDVAVLRVLP